MQAMTQERRRYGFVLERQCSLAKHYLSYHTTGMNIYQAHLDDWGEVAKTREYLPESVESMFAAKYRVNTSLPYHATFIRRFGIGDDLFSDILWFLDTVSECVNSEITYFFKYISLFVLIVLKYLSTS